MLRAVRLAGYALAWCAAVMAGACGSDDGGGGHGAPDAATGGTANDASTAGAPGDAMPDATSAHALSLDFERVKPGTDFVAIVTARDGGNATAGLAITIESSRGNLGTVSDQGDGTYRASIAKDALGTGEYGVTAGAGTWSAPVSRTAVVMKEVGARWGQPQAFAGLVNTPAWEDSLAISPDGEWIVLEYLPVSPTCLLQHFDDPTHPTCAKAIGPWQAPERPAMPGAERIAADGTIHNGCPSLNFDPAPFAVPPQSLFGFRRQADGSFAEPFAIFVDNLDGCVSAFGPSMLAPVGGKVPFVFAFDTPLDGDPPAGTQGDIYFTELELGKPAVLASYASGQINMNATLLGFPTAGHQGNPHYFSVAGTTQIWVDDETSTEKDLTVYELTGAFPAGPWIGPTALPSPLSAPGVEDIQPFYDGSEALWTRSLGIASSAHVSGPSGPVTAAASWGPVSTELAGETGSPVSGKIVAVGEPTKAIRGGRQVLAFVYAMLDQSGYLDINAGYVEEQP